MHDSYSICATLETLITKTLVMKRGIRVVKYRSKFSRLRKIFEKKILPRLNREKCNPETGPI